MARRIIVLETQRGPGRDTEIRAAFWADVPAARQPFYADQSKVSVVKDVNALELADLQAGKFVEEVRTYRDVPGNATTAQIKARLVTEWTAYQAEVTGRNDWPFYGTSYDPGTTAWTDKTVG